jgi:hypothetical protein
MKKVLILFSLTLAFTYTYAQNDVNATSNDNWIGYMNVFNLGGGYEFGNSWGVSDLKTTIDSSANTITLQPNFNTYADNPGDPFWMDTVTMEGAKMMDASTFVEPGSTFNGTDLTFRGNVSSNTLDTSYTAEYFIKALDPNAGYSDALGGNYLMSLPASGDFSTTVPAAELTSGLIIQYGFRIYGRNANPTNEANLGSIVISSQTTSTSTERIDEENSISIFPNPAQEVLNIQTDERIQQLRVVNLQGQAVKTFQEFNATSIKISDLAVGTYFIEFLTPSGREIQKFIKG